MHKGDGSPTIRDISNRNRAEADWRFRMRKLGQQALDQKFKLEIGACTLDAGPVPPIPSCLNSEICAGPEAKGSWGKLKPGGNAPNPEI